jgi:hypothetical protein
VLLPALKLPPEVQVLLLKCLALNPEERWTVQDLLGSPVLQEGYRGLELWVRPLQVYLELVAPVDYVSRA